MLGHDDFVLAALMESKLVDRATADRAARLASEKGGRPSDHLVALGAVSAQQLAVVRAEVAEIPFVDLSWYDVDLRHTALLPKAIAEAAKAFVLFACGNVVTVGMADPQDLKQVDQVRAAIGGYEVESVLCEPSQLRSLIDRGYSLSSGAGVGTVAVDPASTFAGDAKEPIVAAVNQMIVQGLDLGASDIHIGADDTELYLRYRVDGALQRMQGPSLAMHQSIVQRLKVMANLDLTQTRRPQDGKFRFTSGGRGVDVRISFIPTVTGENVVMRVLASASGVRGFAELGFAQEHIAFVESAIESPYGMLLVTGPTGSGKTTTLYTALKRLNTPDVNIITIEDPVEIRMPMLRQVQVNHEIGMTFASALRSVLRQDPDVVLVGEIRDEETARISVQAALTGHLVLSSLHANDAAGALPRLRDLNVPSFAVNAALLAVIAQRLVRRVCAECAKKEPPDAAWMERFALRDGEGFVRGAGCGRCLNTGYRGRLGVYEVLRMSPLVRRAVERGESGRRIGEVARGEGFREMWQDGLAKARLGLTTLEEVGRVVAIAATAEGDEAAPEARKAA